MAIGLSGIEGKSSITTNSLPKLQVKINQYSKDSVQAFLPVKMNVTDDDVERINRLASDKELADSFKENIVSFASVLGESKNSVSDYVSAVTFVSNRLLGKSHVDAWRGVFPERYDRLVSLGKTRKNIEAHARAYTRRKLVTAITKQTLTPSYVYNASLFQQALNVTADIMLDESVHPRDRVSAAKEVMAHTAIPESFRDGDKALASQGTSLVEKLADTLNKLASTQQAMVQDKQMTAKQVAGSRVYDNSTQEIINERG